MPGNRFLRVNRRSPTVHLHPAQDDAEQPPHPEPDEEDGEPVDPFPVPNRDIRFVVSAAPQEGHRTSGFDPKTSFSKQCWHLSH